MAQDAPAGNERLQATIVGRVQGIGFRWFVCDRANDLDLVGWVRNRNDGAVEVLAEGPPDALELLLAALRHGPRGAVVTGVQVARGPAAGGLREFEIRAGYHLGD